MEMTDLIDDPAKWLNLLPADVPEDYRRDVRAEARATARHGQIGALVAALEAKVAAGAADPSVDPAGLTGPASELAAARAIASVLPAVVPVSQGRHNDVAAGLPRPNGAMVALPHPPRYVAELVHHQRIHTVAGEMPPTPGPLDVEAAKAYEKVSAEVAAQWSTLCFLGDGPRGPMGDFVAGWHATVNNTSWVELNKHIADLVVLVARADAERPVGGSCKFGHHSAWRLQPAQLADGPWTFEAAVHHGVLVQVTP
jgi:hypothetical protein